jgi:hypothetical protein
MNRLLVAVILAASLAGCLFHDRSGLAVELVNDTPDPHQLRVVVERGEEGTETYNETHDLAAAPADGSEEVKLGELVDADGEYRFRGELANGSRVSETVAYSDDRGPDIVQFVVRQDGLAIDIMIV